MKQTDLSPISFMNSFWYFAIPGLILFAGLNYGVPHFYSMGYDNALVFLFFLWMPIIPLLPLSFLLFLKEKKQNPSLQFSKRFRFTKITKRHWLWIVIGISFVAIFDFIIMEPVSKWMATNSTFSPPEHFPALLNPLKESVLPLNDFLGTPLKGNWLFLASIVILHTVAILAEEMMWRGYILPRQELRHGKKAWLINGLQWGYLLHFFMKWNFISFLPSMLITPFIAQRCRNTWVAVLIHGIPNSIIWFLILGGVTA